MSELETDRELNELLTILKSAERKAIDSEDFHNAQDIFIIHMAVIRASYDMDSALDALARIFGRSDENA